MRAIVVSALVLASLSAGSAAYGDPEVVPATRACDWEYAETGSGDYTGVMYGRPVAAASVPNEGSLTGNPVSVTVVCTFHVFGVFGNVPDPAISTSGSGTVVAVAPPTQVAFHEDGVEYFDWVTAACATAYVTDAQGVTRTYYQSDENGAWVTSPGTWDCDGWRCIELVAACDDRVWLAVWTIQHVDPDPCPALAALAPGVPGVVDIGPDGDVYYGGEQVWYCPTEWG